jgi:hypothetical protein
MPGLAAAPALLLSTYCAGICPPNRRGSSGRRRRSMLRVAAHSDRRPVALMCLSMPPGCCELRPIQRPLFARVALNVLKPAGLLLQACASPASVARLLYATRQRVIAATFGRPCRAPHACIHYLPLAAAQDGTASGPRCLCRLVRQAAGTSTGNLPARPCL